MCGEEERKSVCIVAGNRRRTTFSHVYDDDDSWPTRQEFKRMHKCIDPSDRTNVC